MKHTEKTVLCKDIRTAFESAHPGWKVSAAEIDCIVCGSGNAKKKIFLASIVVFDERGRTVLSSPASKTAPADSDISLEDVMTKGVEDAMRSVLSAEEKDRERYRTARTVPAREKRNFSAEMLPASSDTFRSPNFFSCLGRFFRREPGEPGEPVRNGRSPSPSFAGHRFE